MRRPHTCRLSSSTIWEQKVCAACVQSVDVDAETERLIFFYKQQNSRATLSGCLPLPSNFAQCSPSPLSSDQHIWQYCSSQQLQGVTNFAEQEFWVGQIKQRRLNESTLFPISNWYRWKSKWSRNSSRKLHIVTHQMSPLNVARIEWR